MLAVARASRPQPRQHHQSSLSELRVANLTTIAASAFASATASVAASSATTSVALATAAVSIASTGYVRP